MPVPTLREDAEAASSTVCGASRTKTNSGFGSQPCRGIQARVKTAARDKRSKVRTLSSEASGTSAHCVDVFSSDSSFKPGNDLRKKGGNLIRQCIEFGLIFAEALELESPKHLF